MNRKRLTLLLLVLLCITVASTALSEGYVSLSVEDPVKSGITIRSLYPSSGAVAEQTLWLYDQYAVYQVTADGNALRDPAISGYIESHISSEAQGKRFGITSWNDCLLLCDWENGVILTAHPSIEIMAKISLPATERYSIFLQPICAGDSLYVCAVPQNSYDVGTLYRLDLSNGGPAELVDTRVYGIAPWTDESVLVMKRDAANVYAFRFWAVSPSQEPELIAETEGLNFYGLVSIPEKQSFYWQSETMLYGYEQGEIEAIRSVPSVYGADFALIDDEKYIISSNRGLGTFDLSNRPESMLTIKGWYNLLEETDSLFLTAYPDIALAREATSSVRAQDVYSDILMGDSSTDLYYIPYTSGLRKMMAQGYAEVLTGSEVLMQDHQRLYAPLQEPLMHQGQLYAVPAQVEYGNWKLTVDAPEAFDTPQTLPEMLELLVSWEEHEANVGQCCLGLIMEYREWTALDWLDMALHQMLLPYGEDERPDVAHCKELLEIMELVKRTYKEARLPLLPEDARKISPDKPAAIMAYGGNRGMYGIALEDINYDDYPVSQPALFEDAEHRYPAVMMVYVLNPLSQRKEEAMLYLEWLAQHRPAQIAAWLQQDSEPMLREWIEEEVAEMQDEAEKAALLRRRESWLVYEPHLRFYQEEILPGMTVMAHPLLERQRVTTQPIYPDILEQMTRYLMDTQSAQQCLTQIQQIMDAWWLESQ